MKYFILSVALPYLNYLIMSTSIIAIMVPYIVNTIYYQFGILNEYISPFSHNTSFVHMFIFGMYALVVLLENTVRNDCQDLNLQVV